MSTNGLRDALDDLSISCSLVLANSKGYWEILVWRLERWFYKTYCDHTFNCTSCTTSYKRFDWVNLLCEWLLVLNFELIVISRNITHFLLFLRFSTHYFYRVLHFPIDQSVKIFHFRDYDDSHFDCYGHIFFWVVFVFFVYVFEFESI